jgi:hypothetical protein
MLRKAAASVRHVCGTLMIACACALVLMASAAAADVTAIRVLFRDGPVPAGVPVEIIDVRSGIVVARTATDRRGRAMIEGLQASGLYEAQTPDGHFVTAAFEPHDPAALHIVDERGPLAAAAISLAAQGGEVSNGVGLRIDDPTSPPTAQSDDGDGGFYGLAIRGRVVGPEWPLAGMRLFIEGGVEPENTFSNDVTTGLTRTVSGGSVALVESVAWQRDLAWDIGLGVAVEIPNPLVRAWGEFKLGFHREALDADVQQIRSTVQVLHKSVHDMDSLLIGLQVPVELWRRGGVSLLLETGMTARILVGNNTADVFTGIADAPTELVRHRYKPSSTVAGHIGLRLQYDYSLLPSFD